MRKEDSPAEFKVRPNFLIDLMQEQPDEPHVDLITYTLLPSRCFGFD